MKAAVDRALGRKYRGEKGKYNTECAIKNLSSRKKPLTSKYRQNRESLDSVDDNTEDVLRRSSTDFTQDGDINTDDSINQDEGEESNNEMGGEIKDERERSIMKEIEQLVLKMSQYYHGTYSTQQSQGVPLPNNEEVKTLIKQNKKLRQLGPKEIRDIRSGYLLKQVEEDKPLVYTLLQMLLLFAILTSSTASTPLNKLSMPSGLTSKLPLAVAAESVSSIGTTVPSFITTTNILYDEPAVTPPVNESTSKSPQSQDHDTPATSTEDSEHYTTTQPIGQTQSSTSDRVPVTASKDSKGEAQQSTLGTEEDGEQPSSRGKRQEAESRDDFVRPSLHQQLAREREEAARRWAPIIWLHPEERYFPGDVQEFLANVDTSGTQMQRDRRTGRFYKTLPIGKPSEELYLSAPLDTECFNCPLPDFLHGLQPAEGHGAPVYTSISWCYSSVPTTPHGAIDYILESSEGGSSAKRSLRKRLALLPNPLPRPPRYRRWGRLQGTGRWRGRRSVWGEGNMRVSFQRTTTASPEPLRRRRRTVQELPPDTTDDTNTNSSHSSISIPWAMDIITQHAKENNVRKWSKVTFKKPNTSDKKKLAYQKLEEGASKGGATDPTTSMNVVRFRIENDGTESLKPTNSLPTSQPILPSTAWRETAESYRNPVTSSKRPDKRHIVTSPLSINTFSNEATSQGSTEFVKRLPFPSGCKGGSCETLGPTRGHHFTITYWFFYPYNRGKNVCTSKVWLFGRVAKPLFKGQCLGQNLVMGNHVGDWEHVSVFFENGSPKHVYISAHNFGAYYSYNALSGHFEYMSQDTREGIPVSATFAPQLETVNGRIVLHSALGSHGLWPGEGSHQYNSILIPLTDVTAKGYRWDTWKNLQLIDSLALQSVNTTLDMQWLHYRGHWGNPSNKCHPGLLGFCEVNHGPTGIPMKRVNFPCDVPNHYTFPKT